MYSCILIGVIVASSDGTSIHYAYADESILLRRDIASDVALLAQKPLGDVQIVEDKRPYLPPVSMETCNRETLGAKFVRPPNG